MSCTKCFFYMGLTLLWLAFGCSDAMRDPEVFAFDPGTQIKGAHFYKKVNRDLSRTDQFVVNDNAIVRLWKVGNEATEPTVLQQVVIVDEETIRGVVPGSLSLGIYIAEVETPYGLTGGLDNALTVIPSGTDVQASGEETDINPNTSNDSQLETDTDAQVVTDSQVLQDTVSVTEIETASDSESNSSTMTDEVTVQSDNSDTELKGECYEDGVRYEHDEICWYLGDPGESCTTVCTPRGGYHPDTATYDGSADQGGSEVKCEALLLAILGYEVDVTDVTATSSESSPGLGCYILEGDNRWFGGTLFDPDRGSNRGAQTVCGCYSVDVIGTDTSVGF